MSSVPTRHPTIAVTVGDINGIGPEVVLKSIVRPEVQAMCTPLLVGPATVFRHYARRLKIALHVRPVRLSDILESPDTLADVTGRETPVLDTFSKTPTVRPGTISAHAGTIAARSIEQATLLAQTGVVTALVTAPVSKRSMHRAGFRFPGQTELLQSLTSAPRVGMMLVSRAMRIGLVTIHIPISEVHRSITPTLLRDRIQIFFHGLRSDWAIEKPKVAVLALNPHAGEGGDIGTEDETVIKPVIAEMRRNGLDINGPFPADAFFGRYSPGTYDAVIAMYHDQGLIPLKMSAFGRAVNVSVGLPIIRTSPDHGTAFDIAGKGIADPGSMMEAIRVACLIQRNRSKVLSSSLRSLERTIGRRKHTR